MKNKTISLIYFYLISAVSLGLIVVGIFQSVNYIINITQYDKYPLAYISETCDFLDPSGPKPVYDVPMGASPSADQFAKQKQSCEQRVELERKQRQVNDLKNAITFSLVGVILFLIHFPQARKQSKD